MPTFAYQASDATGLASSGQVKADSRAAAIEQLSARGLWPTFIVAGEDGTAGPQRARTGLTRVAPAAVEAFTRELANLLAAGVSLSKALQILRREASSAAARRQWETIHDDVVGGTSLADALAKWPRSFPPVYIAMVRAGETGGFLDLVLNQIAELRGREQDLKGKVKSALIYPAVLGVLASAVLIFLLIYFIPRFSTIFADFGGELPQLTQAIVATSKALVGYGWLIALLIVAAGLSLRRALATDTGRRRLERLALGVPGFGVVTARFALVRFARMLGTLLGAGVPLVTALRVANAAIGNQTLSDTVSQAVQQVQQGTALAASLATCEQLFPRSVVEMVAVAEESGRLDQELIRMAGTYEAELDRRLRALVALAAPAMLFVMAAIVGTVVIGMLLPVFALQDLIR